MSYMYMKEVNTYICYLAKTDNTLYNYLWQLLRQNNEEEDPFITFLKYGLIYDINKKKKIDTSKTFQNTKIINYIKTWFQTNEIDVYEKITKSKSNNIDIPYIKQILGRWPTPRELKEIFNITIFKSYIHLPSSYLNTRYKRSVFIGKRGINLHILSNTMINILYIWYYHDDMEDILFIYTNEPFDHNNKLFLATLHKFLGMSKLFNIQ